MKSQSLFNFLPKKIKLEETILPQPKKICRPEESKIKEEISQQSTSSRTEQEVSEQTDIALHLNKIRKMNDRDKHHFLVNHWKPSKDFQFPHSISNGKKNQCQYKWFTAYPWLAYSPSAEKIYCISCLFFPQANSHSNLSSFGSNNWRNPRLAEHAKSKAHINADICSQAFLANLKNPSLAVDVALNRIQSAQVAKNRERLKPAIMAIEYLGRGNCPLRGHRDDSEYYNLPGISSIYVSCLIIKN